jgi:hypothetical protein
MAPQRKVTFPYQPWIAAKGQKNTNVSRYVSSRAEHAEIYSRSIDVNLIKG